MTAPTTTAKGEIKVVGRSGQISLGKRYAGQTLELERLEDGSILLRAVAVIPRSQLWTLKEPDRSRIERGLEWAGANAPRESSLAALPRPGVKRRKTSRGPNR
jgi:hypothetical protein